MTDVVDEAQEVTEAFIAQSLRNRKTLTIPFSGVCLSCEEPVEGQRRFCDSECRADWENELKRKFGVTRPT